MADINPDGNTHLRNLESMKELLSVKGISELLFEKVTLHGICLLIRCVYIVALSIYLSTSLSLMHTTHAHKNTQTHTHPLSLSLSPSFYLSLCIPMLSNAFAMISVYFILTPTDNSLLSLHFTSSHYQTISLPHFPVFHYILTGQYSQSQRHRQLGVTRCLDDRWV